MQKGEKLNFQKMTETTSSRIQREMLILEKKPKQNNGLYHYN